jgi:hypothetical protein
MKRQGLTFLGAAALVLGAVGCNGGEGGGGGAGTGGNCDVPALFAAKACSIAGCHSSSSPAAAFDMQTAGWETAMVGKTPPGGGAAATMSMCMGMGQYLVAGSQPATGLFIDKLAKATPQCGARMPNLPLDPGLTAAELACVQTWANALTKP